MSESTPLTTQLLIAMPALRDPNFPRGVAFLCQHGEDGAMGLMINRLSEYRLGDVLAQMSMHSEIPEVIDAPEVRCVIAGETHYEGRLLDDKSTYYIPEGVRTSPIESPKGAELLVFSLPMYAKAAWDKAHGRETVAA